MVIAFYHYHWIIHMAVFSRYTYTLVHIAFQQYKKHFFFYFLHLLSFDIKVTTYMYNIRKKQKKNQKNEYGLFQN